MLTSKLDCAEFFRLGGVFVECEERWISLEEVRMVLVGAAGLRQGWSQQGQQHQEAQHLHLDQGLEENEDQEQAQKHNQITL